MNGEHRAGGEPHSTSPRDEALRLMVNGGWADQTVTSLTATAARISISGDELHEVVDAFTDEFSGAGLTEYTQLVGHFLVVENEGVVRVTTHPDEDRLIGAFDEVARRLAEGGDPTASEE
jgi:hypothetical protein